MRLSDLPLPTRAGTSAGPRIVTLGGGHGQAALLTALSRLDCDLTAIVSVADDGGCSGKLRAELGMPPPGDVRRCLVSLATMPDAATLFEERLRGGDEEGRCVGNLVLAEMRKDVGSLQKAVDWAAALLGCIGRVVPAAEVAGVLTVYDLVHGPLHGESQIEKLSSGAMVARVDGPEHANPRALEAIAKADLILFGPGSFVGSTLAVLTTANIAEAVVRAPGRRVLIRNVRAEEHTGVPGAVSFDHHERMLRDHLVIGSGGDTVSFDALTHDAKRRDKVAREDGSYECYAKVADAGGRGHDPDRLGRGIAHHYGLRPRPPAPVVPPSPLAITIFERYLKSARSRLAALAANGPGGAAR